MSCMQKHKSVHDKLGKIISPFGDTNRIRKASMRKFNTDKCRVLCSGIRNQIHKYEMGNNCLGSSIPKRSWRACGLQNGLFKKRSKNQQNPTTTGSVLGNISSNVSYIKNPSSMYYLKGEVIISFCSVLRFDLDMLLIIWRKTKKSPEARITEGLKGKK